MTRDRCSSKNKGVTLSSTHKIPERDNPKLPERTWTQRHMIKLVIIGLIVAIGWSIYSKVNPPKAVATPDYKTLSTQLESEKIALQAEVERLGRELADTQSRSSVEKVARQEEVIKATSRIRELEATLNANAIEMERINFDRVGMIKTRSELNANLDRLTKEKEALAAELVSARMRLGELEGEKASLVRDGEELRKQLAAVSLMVQATRLEVPEEKPPEPVVSFPPVQLESVPEVVSDVGLEVEKVASSTGFIPIVLPSAVPSGAPKETSGEWKRLELHPGIWSERYSVLQYVSTGRVRVIPVKGLSIMTSSEGLFGRFSSPQWVSVEEGPSQIVLPEGSRTVSLCLDVARAPKGSKLVIEVFVSKEG